MTAPPALAGSQPPVLAATQMTKHFTVSRGLRAMVSDRRVVHAVDDATVQLAPGEIVAVVGESGSGKTTLGRLMSRLELPTSGSLQVDGKPVPTGGARSLRAFRRRV
jgi:peptide/nickel transport system ATP-binding protein